MGKIKILVATITAVLLVGCTNETNEIETPVDSDNTNPCEIEYNEVFEMCSEPVLSSKNFTEFELNINDEYNTSGNRMISNLLYNYMSATLDFDLNFKTQDDVKNITITVKNMTESKEIFYDRVFYNPSTSLNQSANVSFQESFHLEELEAGNKYSILFEYMYSTSNHTVQDRVLAGFKLDTTMISKTRGPKFTSFELLDTTTSSAQMKFKIIHRNNELNNLDIRIYNNETKEFTGVSHQITDLTPYKEEYLYVLSPILLDGLDSNTAYNIRVYVSGSNPFDEYDNALLFGGDELSKIITD